jgi:hypothetical protein
VTDFISLLCNDKEPSINECVVRVRTSYWRDSRGLYAKKSVIFLRRRCVGYNILEEDVGQMDVESVMTRIVNLDACPDGVYYAAVCNEYRDWETGYIEDYDYELRPMVSE